MASQENQITVIFHDVEENDEHPLQLYLHQQIRDIYDLFDENYVKERDTYYLTYNGKVLHKSWTLKDEGIPNGGRIDICTREFIKVTFRGSNITFNGANEIGAQLATECFIGDIKKELSNVINKPPNHIQIYWNDQELTDASTLLSLGISTDTIMTVKYEEWITFKVSFFGTTSIFQLLPTSTIQAIFDMVSETFNDVTIASITAKHKGRECAPTQTLRELGVQDYDTIEVDLTIYGSAPL